MPNTFYMKVVSCLCHYHHQGVVQCSHYKPKNVISKQCHSSYIEWSTSHLIFSVFVSTLSCRFCKKKFAKKDLEKKFLEL